MKKALWLFAVIMALGLSGCSLQEEGALAYQEGDTMQKSYTEIAEIFDKYDIEGTDPQLLDELEESYTRMPPEVELSKAAILLTSLGQGDYDYSNGTWTPCQNGVYSFDVEVFDVENMYANFLLGISALDKEELDFKNVQEDTSQVDWEEGNGKRTVAFEWKNEEFTLEAEVEYDWFDLNVIKELNEIVKEHGDGRQLFVADDGYQERIVFYRTKEWAEEFQKETGIKLTEIQ